MMGNVTVQATNTRIGVVGAGTMGRGIAQTAAQSGYRVVLHDVHSRAVIDAVADISRNLSKQVGRGELTDQDAGGTRSRLTTAVDMAELMDCEIVIEAVSESLDLKRRVLGTIEEHVSSDALLATNTSSIPVTTLGASLHDSSRFVGMHFFNPVPRMPLVELVPTVLTSQASLVRAERFVRALGKSPIVASDGPGFVVNALLVPFLLSAARMVGSGYASAEIVDEGMRLGAGHPMGPLQLSDLIGLDVLCDIADSLAEETADPAFAVPSSLRSMVEAGWTGRKAGKGFYPY